MEEDVSVQRPYTELFWIFNSITVLSCFAILIFLFAPPLHLLYLSWFLHEEFTDEHDMLSFHVSSYSVSLALILLPSGGIVHSLYWECHLLKGCPWSHFTFFKYIRGCIILQINAEVLWPVRTRGLKICGGTWSCSLLLSMQFYCSFSLTLAFCPPTFRTSP